MLHNLLNSQTISNIAWLINFVGGPQNFIMLSGTVLASLWLKCKRENGPVTNKEMREFIEDIREIKRKM